MPTGGRIGGSIFLDCPALLRPTGKEVYYKFCLRKFASDVELMPEEKTPTPISSVHSHRSS